MRRAIACDRLYRAARRLARDPEAADYLLRTSLRKARHALSEPFPSAYSRRRLLRIMVGIYLAGCRYNQAASGPAGRRLDDTYLRDWIAESQTTRVAGDPDPGWPQPVARPPWSVWLLPSKQHDGE